MLINILTNNFTGPINCVIGQNDPPVIPLAKIGSLTAKIVQGSVDIIGAIEFNDTVHHGNIGYNGLSDNQTVGETKNTLYTRLIRYNQNQKSGQEKI